MNSLWNVANVGTLATGDPREVVRKDVLSGIFSVTHQVSACWIYQQFLITSRWKCRNATMRTLVTCSSRRLLIAYFHPSDLVHGLESLMIRNGQESVVWELVISNLIVPKAANSQERRRHWLLWIQCTSSAIPTKSFSSFLGLEACESFETNSIQVRTQNRRFASWISSRHRLIASIMWSMNLKHLRWRSCSIWIWVGNGPILILRCLYYKVEERVLCCQSNRSVQSSVPAQSHNCVL